jgi:PEGA domain
MDTYSKGNVMKKFVVWIVLVSFALSGSGCCTIFGGGSQMITVDSKPDGAKVQLGSLQGITPYQVKLPKGKDYAIRVSYAGKTQSTPLEKKIDGVFWINILIFPGLIIDAATGNMYKYDPTVYNFDFTGK